MAKKTMRRLPRSFDPPEGAAADLFPELIAAKAFFEIAQAVGVDEAQRIFEETARKAKSLLPTQTKPEGAHSDLEALRLSLAWQLWQKQHPGKTNKSAFGRWYVKMRDWKHVAPASIVRQLDRLIDSRKHLN